MATDSFVCVIIILDYSILQNEQVKIMGRSSMQGTPWHYEYGSGKRKGNSKHCVYNVGHCSHKYSQYYKKECEGRAYCDDFELSNFANPDLDQSPVKVKKKTKQKKKAQPSKKKATKQDIQAPIKIYKEYLVSDRPVKLGDKITVINVKTQSKLTMNISNSQDPFIGKKINQQVVLKSGQFKIVKIIGKEER